MHSNKIPLRDTDSPFLEFTQQWAFPYCDRYGRSVWSTVHKAVPALTSFWAFPEQCAPGFYPSDSRVRLSSLCCYQRR